MTTDVSSQTTSASSEPEKIVHMPWSSFFANGLHLNTARSTFLRVLISSAFVVSLVIFAIFSIFWGSLWKTPAHALPGFIVDFDNSNVGQAVTQGLLQSNTASSRIAWSVLPAAGLSGPDQVAEMIINESAWVAVVINSGSTSRLTTAVSSPDAAFSPSDALIVYASEARNENAFRSIIRPSIQGALEVITERYAETFASSLSSTSLGQLLSISPQTLTRPIGYTLHNLRPFDVPVASSVTFVGLIYLTILSFFLVVIGGHARLDSGIEKHLTTGALIRLRLVSIFGLYFIISLCYSLLSLAFQVDFSRNRFGHAGFVVFWMVNWVGMLSLGLALEAMVTILTPRFIPFFLIFWIIINVSINSLPLEVLPHIFRYGYAMPFYNISRAVRTIIFNTKDTLGLNFGILLGWAALSCLTLTFFQWYVRRGLNSNGVLAAPKDTEKGRL